MKKLTTKKIYLYLIFSNLKRTPPRDYPDTNEMMVTVDEVLPALETATGEFLAFSKRADDINNAVAAGGDQSEARTKIEDLQKEVRIFEVSPEGVAMVTAELSSSAFGILSAQFERWGKGNSEKQIPGWFNKIEDFVSFSKDLKKSTD